MDDLAGGDRPRAVGGYQLHVVAAGEDGEGAGHFAPAAAVAGEDLLAAQHHEVLVAARHRVEGGDLLLALGDQDAGHNFLIIFTPKGPRRPA